MLSSVSKRRIIEEILKRNDFLGRYNTDDGIVDFLNRILDLRTLPSTDDRYENAYDDVVQHLVRNHDWDYEYLFFDRFKIDQNNDYFKTFIETIVSPNIRKDKDEILLYVVLINKLLTHNGYRLALVDYFEELPIYKMSDSLSLMDLPEEIVENKIAVYHSIPKNKRTYPSFELTPIPWDDFGAKTKFYLTYYHNDSKFEEIGEIKLMVKDELQTTKVLPHEFTSLSSDFCSLGQATSFYLTLKSVLKDNYSSFLFAIKDVATFPRLYEQFENLDIFRKSLIRNNNVERLARTIRYELEGVRLEEYYKFTYQFTPPYSTKSINLAFNFDYTSDFQNRIYAIIGKNGTGKTKILSSLALELSKSNPDSFLPRKPIYGKIFTISYSSFDKFTIPNEHASFNYVYCGLKKSDNTWKSEEELYESFHNTVSLIKEKKLENEWHGLLTNFMSKDILDAAFKTLSGPPGYLYEFSFDAIPMLRTSLSSGQSIVLFLISEIISKIRFDSLILFDEPETHLHPNAISELINLLYTLVKTYESFCIIATHSPLIIQEIPSKNVIVIDRDDNEAFVRRLERESFTENLTIITQEIFGNREVPKYFIKVINELIESGKEYTEIISILKSQDLPVSSNLELYVSALLSS